ncbi:MAG TPA: peptide-methionine (S)-S-oxide reductase MsrA [Cyclobacteriaceae bacterium]|jgi:peptide-methionine (S)-S-oxide reductase|nr:peptide-methionine (S)-S-oxide reductase MsrA [Cyclobacteriaceae bacterium]
MKTNLEIVAAGILTVVALSTLAQNKKPMESSELKTATFGAGCFWCTEAVFLNVNGVTKVVSGYSGGKVKNPTYREVCSGLTGHAEVTQITYDPKKVSFEDLLEVFWNTHDPTTLNRQGADEGTQYRSAVFYNDDEQKKTAEQYKKQLEASHVYKNPIVTEISPLINFYPAEDYHQNYYALNPEQGYCQYVIRPKVDKFKKQFSAKLKK